MIFWLHCASLVVTGILYIISMLLYMECLSKYCNAPFSPSSGRMLGNLLLPFSCPGLSVQMKLQVHPIPIVQVMLLFALRIICRAYLHLELFATFNFSCLYPTRKQKPRKPKNSETKPEEPEENRPSQDFIVHMNGEQILFWKAPYFSQE